MLKTPAAEDVPLNPNCITFNSFEPLQVDPQSRRVMWHFELIQSAFHFWQQWIAQYWEDSSKPGNTFFNTIHFGKHVSQISALLVNLRLQVTCISQNVQGRGKVFRKGVVQPVGKKNHKQDHFNISAVSYRQKIRLTWKSYGCFCLILQNPRKIKFPNCDTNCAVASETETTTVLKGRTGVCPVPHAYKQGLN